MSIGIRHDALEVPVARPARFATDLVPGLTKPFREASDCFVVPDGKGNV
jgi:hypothetical protein